ncbi:hypothetical protein RB200_19540 [Streptomyces sp. PmtG]
MTLPTDFPIQAPEGDADPDQTTTYQASRGGWYPTDPKPVPGTPQNG